MPSTTRYAAAPNVLLTQLSEAEAVLLHTRTREYFSLNETGLRIWTALAGGQTPEQTAALLEQEYEVTRDDAIGHVRSFIRDVETAGLLTCNDAH